MLGRAPSSTMAAASPDTSPGDPDKEEKRIGDHEVDGGVTGVLEPQDLRNADGSSINSASDVLALQDMDPAMNMKMHLVNNVSSGFGGSWRCFRIFSVSCLMSRVLTRGRLGIKRLLTRLAGHPTI